MSDPEKHEIYVFEGFRLDPNRRLLLDAAGQPVPIKPKVLDTLALLVERCGELLDKGTLMQAVWGDVIVEENSLNQHISILRQVFGETPGENRFIVTVPGRGYRFVAKVQRAPAHSGDSAAASWRQRLAGRLAIARRESSVSKGSTKSVRATRPFKRAFIAILALAAVVLAVDRFVLEQIGASGDEPWIAVLAFDNLSPDGDLEYFSDGISIELMELLTKIPDLRVIAPESAFWFKGRDATYAEIGEKLGVGRLLDGAVLVAGDQVRVTASLIDPNTGAQVWSYSPEARPMSDVFAIQTEIATEIVEELRIALTGALPALDQTSPEVHWLYLRARHILDTPELSRLAYARAMLEQAVEDDPNYFPARYQLAKAYFYLGVSGELERAKGLSLVERTMEQAALQWGDRPEIMTFRALMAFENRDYATAAQYLERSLQQDPSPSEPWAMAVNLLNRLGRHEDAIQVGEHVLLRNPICAPCYQALMLNHFMVREFEEAVDIYAQAENIGLELFPDFWYAAALLFSGDAEAALAEYQRDGMGRLPKLAGSAMALHELGQTPEYDQTLAELVQNELVRSEPENGVFPAMVYAFVGDKARAFEFLNSLPQPDALIFSDPHFDSLREDPRFEDLLKRSNIWPDDPRDEIEFNFELPE